MLMFSSGTTGLPKAVQLTHHNWIANHILLIENHPKTYDLRRLLVFPFFHVASTPQTMISPFREGVTTYVMRRFELEPYLQNIVKYSITDMVVVPPMAIAIIMSPLSKQYSLKSIRHGVVGAAPLGKEPQARLQALLHPDTPFTQIWGMTEVSCVGSFTPWPHHENTGSVGKFLNNVDVKLVDDNGKDITAGDTRGELCIRGPIVTRGYYENDEANKRDFDEDGFFHTGDIAYMDAKTEKWYIVDRKKVSSSFPLF
jgi:4-coumarate--CoA ligase